MTAWGKAANEVSSAVGGASDWVAAGASVVAGASMIARAVIGVVVALERDGPVGGARCHRHDHRSDGEHRRRPAAQRQKTTVRASVGVVDLDARRPEFGRVPPRSFVRRKGTWLHEDDIVQLAGMALAAGVAVGPGIATLRT